MQINLITGKNMLKRRKDMNNKNSNMTVEFDSISKNESFARVVVAAFVARLDPTLVEISDIKTAVSEAVTNSIIHGYENQIGRIKIDVSIDGDEVTIVVTDNGIGIDNIEKAMEPMYTSKPELERSGMGFAFMEAFMDELSVESNTGEGTIITMRKVIGKEDDNWDKELD
jgi:stage II sporulation protein AB (anti-sigma F factor)